MEVLVVGAHGGTGQRLVNLLDVDGHRVRGMIRDAGQARTIESLGGTPVVADLEEPDQVEAAVAESQVVVFAAGSGSHTGPEKTVDVDQEAAKRLVDLSEAAGVERFVMLSSMGTRDPEAGAESMRHYYRAKREADDYLQASSLAWTVVRPGRLTYEQGTGMVEVAEVLDRRGEISRDDLAAVMVQCLRVPHTVRKSFEVLAGDVMIGAALENL